MCGITGILVPPDTENVSNLEHTVGRMTARLAHRGPDGGGIWLDAEAGIAMGHRRLSIIDLTPTGHQPMVSAEGRYVIVYNGEIYNYRELRNELIATGASFRGQSDTEVLLEACARWGVRDAARRCNGIFAFALWDRRTRQLTLARDHIGVKPLYWACFENLMIFGSELKALRENLEWQPKLNINALATFFQFNYIPAPWSIYEGVYKLSPGCLLIAESGKAPRIECFWDAPDEAYAGATSRNDTAGAESIGQLEQLLKIIVPQQMIADVPLGVFLSGGIDSSVIAAIAQSESARPIQTFSIGFGGTLYDESPYAKAVADHLRTDHCELHVDGAAALDVIPSLPEIYDEPHADFSQIPTFLVSRLARQRVTVALSGDGGDELFGGYSWYRHRLWLSRWCAQTPNFLKRAMTFSMRTGANILDVAGALVQRNRLAKAADIFEDKSSDPVMHRESCKWTAAENPVLGGTPLVTPHFDSKFAQRFPNLIDRRQLIDLLFYLPDDILTKVDRASMAVALEVRVPLLDQRLVKFAAQLPLDAKIRGQTTKWILRELLYRYVPRRLVDRPKMGFVPPVGAWMRGPCRGWCETLLSERRLHEQGILDSRLIRRRWAEHLTGQVDWTHSLWSVIMFQSWSDNWLGPRRALAASAPINVVKATSYGAAFGDRVNLQ
jgi:asparagine synthase (glutamine-hydrolysing)